MKYVLYYRCVPVKLLILNFSNFEEWNEKQRNEIKNKRAPAQDWV